MKKIITAKKFFLKLYYRTKAVILIWLFYIISLFKKKSQYWVLCERGMDARDNAYSFYLYLQRCHPEIKVYYIIDKNSTDHHRVSENAVDYGSIKNYWVVANAAKIISTHVGTYVPHIGGGKITAICGIHKKFYWLQHGIIRNAIPNLNIKNIKMKKFFCSAMPEYNFLKEKGGYPSSILKCTGLARYDNLFSFEVKPQILIMPTWRSYILTEDKFLQSTYFQTWQKLLENDRLIKMLEANDLRLIFYPHFECQKYLKYFKSYSSNIILGSFEKYDVQTLLKESCLLITDYSSIFFDFAYMKKPLFYFQFDDEDFFGKHYERGYFSDSTMGFGKVYKQVEELILGIEEKIHNSFQLEQVYEQRIDEFFPYRDDNNCERIFTEIIED